jgi:hypothetical protein
MAFPTYVHDPDAFLDYHVDWSDWLTEGDTLAGVLIIAADDVDVATSGYTDTVTYAWVSLSSPVADQKYNITHRATSAQGRIDDRTQTLVCKER